MSYVLALLIIGFLIAIHEMGHFIAARVVNIPVQCFSIGFGPRVWGFSWKGTDCRLSLIPLGGYVLPGIENERDYFRLGLKKRLLFSIGGPLANLLLALPLFAMFNVVKEGVSFAGVVFKPFSQVYGALENIMLGLATIFSNTENISSIVGIVSTGGKFVDSGFAGLLLFAIIMTLNLAVFNLLPLPPLDGGKIVMDILERVQPKLSGAYMPACVAGWVMLIGLMLYATALDISRLASLSVVMA